MKPWDRDRIAGEMQTSREARRRREDMQQFVTLGSDIVVDPMRGSAFAVVVYPGGVCPKLAAEIGAAILMQKPILIAALPGVEVPEKLARVADSVVEVDPTDPTGCLAFDRAVVELVDRLPRKQPDEQ